ncbi:alpha/beta fold hydrolase [Halocatena halophila]|uniref:alpha/beta fold hydrolase n=1 Tax=Halocatena halophila TaxID=2814576 RepID=UPI0038B3BFAE
MDRTLFTPQLSTLSDTYRTIAYDLRARTDRYEGPYNLSALADDLAALLDTLNVESIVLAGVSTGGFMALDFVNRYPERVRGIILINSMAASHTETERNEYSNLAAQVRKNGPTDQLLDIGRVRMFGETTRETNPVLVEHWVNRWRTYPGEAIYYEMQSWIGREDFTDKLSNITVPFLSIHGTEDTVLAPERTESMLTQVPYGDQVLIEDAGHSAPIERPDPVNHAIREFLSDVSTCQIQSQFSVW